MMIMMMMMSSLLIEINYYVGEHGERPLGEKLPDGFKMKGNIEGETYKLTGAIELHRMVLLEDNNQLERRDKQINRTILDSTCSAEVEYDDRELYGYKSQGFEEVSQQPP